MYAARAVRIKDAAHHPAVDPMAAPVVAEACSDARYTTMLATSSVGRGAQQRRGAIAGDEVASRGLDVVFADPTSVRNVSRPSLIVGPGSTLFTVTPVPAAVSAAPRANATWAVLVTP